MAKAKGSTEERGGRGRGGLGVDVDTEIIAI